MKRFEEISSEGMRMRTGKVIYKKKHPKKKKQGFAWFSDIRLSPQLYKKLDVSLYKKKSYIYHI